MLTERRFNIQPSTGRTERYQYRRVRGGDRGEHVGVLKYRQEVCA